MNEINKKLSSKQILQITNTLRMLGLKSSHKGTKLINKAIQYLIESNIEFFTLEDIYKYLHTLYSFNEKTIKSNINNAITNRTQKTSKSNFEKVFHYEYEESTFEPKTFIEEIFRIIIQNNL